MNDAVGIRVLLTEADMLRLLKLLDAAIFMGKDKDMAPLDHALEGKLEGALMEASSSPPVDDGA